MARVVCEGTGRKPIQSSDPGCWVYPCCPLCSKEFDTNGRRNRHKPNPWTAGCPKHYRRDT